MQVTTIVKFIIAFSLFCSLTAVASEKQFSDLLNDIWTFELRIDPFKSGQTKETRQPANVPDISPEGLEAGNHRRLTFIKLLEKVDRTELSRSEQITWQIQYDALMEKIDQYQFNSHYMPFTSEYGFHMSLSSLPKNTTFKTTQDFEDYISRLEKLEQYIQYQIEWLQLGVEEGYLMPKKAMEGYQETINVMLSDSAEDNLFYQPIKASQLNLSEQLKQRALNALNKHLMPALSKLALFYKQVYQPSMRQSYGIDAIPNGKAFYANRSAYYTTTNKTPEEIHTIGLSEVARISAEMQAVLDQVGFNGSLQAFIQHLRTSPQFYATTEEQLIQYASYLSKKMDAKLPALFHKGELPRTPYGVAPVPKNIAPKYTTGRYISPSNDKQPGLYWVNTYALDKRPLYALPALTLHEAVPGHHLQITLASEMTELPPIRRYTYLSAFGEGWGLYSEFLGKEAGMYTDPYDEFGRLSYEMWRACRLVIDTGIHNMQWSRKQAIDYMTKHTALSSHNINTEIDRYITWPGQALSYKIGEITIRQLRAKAEQHYGNDFDVRDFHHHVLKHGAVPLNILEENIEIYLKKR